jgi:hypothetical protein
MNLVSGIASALYFAGLLLFGLAIIVDLVSMIVLMRRLKRGSGPSPVPVVSWIIYFLWIMIFRGILGSLLTGSHAPAVFTLRDWRDFGLLTVFHLCSQFVIPGIFWRWLIWRRAEHGSFRR